MEKVSEKGKEMKEKKRIVEVEEVVCEPKHDES